MQASRSFPRLLACMMLALLGMAASAQAQTVFQYSLPASWDGVSSTVTDLSTAGNNATLSASPALSNSIPSGAAGGTQSLSSAGGGFHTANKQLLSNTIVAANGGYSYEVYFYWNGTATSYSTQKLIDYAGTESLHLQNINIGAGTADLLFGYDDAAEGPTQSINANTWYKVSAFFDTQGNTIDEGDLDGLATLVVNGVSTSASVTKTAQGDNLNRPIGVGTLPSGSGLVNFNGYIYNPKVTLGLPLAGHWKLNETTGTIATDSSALGNDGTYTNGPLLGQVGPYPGDLAKAAQFNGTNNYVVIPDDSAYSSQVSSGLTVAAWVKVLAWNTDGHSQTRQPIISKGNGGDWEWALNAYDNGLAGFSVWQQGGSTHSEISGGSLPAGTWAHVAATFEPGVANRVYINGQEVALGTTFSGNANDGITNVRIASRLDGQFLNADISDVRIYGRPLSATEIAELYGLVGHWKMDEGTGTTAADSTVFVNDATLNGATWTTNCAGKGALTFDGVSDTAATDAAFEPPATGAVAFWMQASGTPTVRERLFGVNGNWEARLETTGKISFDLGASPYVGNEPFATNIVDEKDRWYHVVAEFNDLDDSYAVYIDGELQANGTSPVNLVPQSPGILSFGTRTGSSENWKGSLRDFRVYNRWLSNDEISKFGGFLAHWKLEETSGTAAIDSSVAGNDASYVGVPVLGVQGPFFAKTGLAVELDGFSTSIASGKSLLNNLPEFTVSGWIRPNSVTPSISLFGQYNLIQLGIGSQTNQIDFWTNSGGSVNATGLLPLGKWTHVAGVGNGTDLKLYVNGIEVSSGGTATANYGSNTSVFKIGEGVLNSAGDYFDGRIDDVRVSSRALCPEEIRTLYKGGRPAGIRILKWVEVR